MAKIYFVDIPQVDSSEWKSVASFKSKQEAIGFCKQRFGADDTGMIVIISEVDDGEETPEEE